uniref:Uncharacterized protein n=1 Tax=Anopheles farauti TaxID=69004 RepID=A0A182QVD4_9DIPT
MKTIALRMGQSGWVGSVGQFEMRNQERLEVLQRHEDQKVELLNVVVREINLVDQIVLAHGERSELDVLDLVVAQVDEVERLQFGKNPDRDLRDLVVGQDQRRQRIEIVKDVARYALEGEVHPGHVQLVQGGQVVQEIEIFELHIAGQNERAESRLVVERVLPDADQFVVAQIDATRVHERMILYNADVVVGEIEIERLLEEAILFVSVR